MQAQIIKFPPDSFYQEAKKEYSDAPTRLIIEFLQNSIDAGARHIHFTFNEEEKTLTIKDNGHGMDQETMVEGLLTFAASIKGDNSVGGFGAAKKLLLFSHDWYEIISYCTKAVGKNITYYLSELPEEESILGTQITIKFGDWWKGAKTTDEWLAIIKFILDNSCIAAKVTFNGVVIPCLPPTEPSLSNDQFEVRECKENYIRVRFNGLYMFRYGYTHKGGYYFDVKPHHKSRDVLTQNREGFRSGTELEAKANNYRNQVTNNSVSGLSAGINYHKSLNTIREINGIRFQGTDAVLTKRRKMIVSLCCAVSRQLFGRDIIINFYGDSRVKGLWADGRIWINSDYFEKEEWELELIETFLHEYIHSRGCDHDEDFIIKFGEVWVRFLKSYKGLNPLKAEMRAIEKFLFP